MLIRSEQMPVVYGDILKVMEAKGFDEVSKKFCGVLLDRHARNGIDVEPFYNIFFNEDDLPTAEYKMVAVNAHYEDLLENSLISEINASEINSFIVPTPPSPHGFVAGGGTIEPDDHFYKDFIKQYNEAFQKPEVEPDAITPEELGSVKTVWKHANGFIDYLQRGGYDNRRISFIKAQDDLLLDFEPQDAEYLGFVFQNNVDPDEMQNVLRLFYLEQEQYLGKLAAQKGKDRPNSSFITTFYNNLETVLNIADSRINLVDFLVDIDVQKNELSCFAPLLHNAVLDTTCPVGEHYLNGDNLGKVIDFYCSIGAKEQLTEVLNHKNFKSLVQNSASQSAVSSALKSSLKKGTLTKLLGEDCREIIKKATDDLPPKDQNRLLSQIDSSQSRLPVATAVSAWGSNSDRSASEKDGGPKEDQFEMEGEPGKAESASSKEFSSSNRTKVFGIGTVVATLAGIIACVAVSFAAPAALGIAITATVIACAGGVGSTYASSQNDKVAFQDEQLKKANTELKSAYQDRGHDRQDNRNREYSHVQEHQQREASRSNERGGRF